MDMYKIILFIGLPGSGKTYHSKKLCDLVIDDIADLSQLPETIGNADLGISDVNFCDDVILRSAVKILREKYPKHFIERIYFENDAEKARKNVILRNDGRNVEGTIRRFEKIYNPPDYAWPIYSGD